MIAAAPSQDVHHVGRHARKEGSRRAFIALHARTRAMPWAMLGYAFVALLTWAVATYVVHLEHSAGARERLLVTALTPSLAAAIAAAGLASADEELERSTAAAWGRLRTLHVLVAGVLAGAALMVTGLWEPQTYGAFELARNTIGYLGLALAAAVIVGARLAWVGPIGYAVVVLAVGRPPQAGETTWWAWQLNPWDAVGGAWVATCLFAAGAALYVVWGSQPARDASG